MITKYTIFRKTTDNDVEYYTEYKGNKISRSYNRENPQLVFPDKVCINVCKDRLIREILKDEGYEETRAKTASDRWVELNEVIKWEVKEI